MTGVPTGVIGDKGGTGAFVGTVLAAGAALEGKVCQL